MRFVQGIVAFGLFVFVIGSALAASQRDRDDCYKLSGDQAIAACTRVIQDRNESTKERAIAYSSRCFEYNLKRELDRAFADCNEAIRLDPKQPEVYDNRGATFYHKGEYDRAITDFTEAIRLNPKNAKFLYDRGLAYRNKSDRNSAIDDLRNALKLGYQAAREELIKLGVTP